MNKSNASITDAAQAFAAYIKKQKSYKASPERKNEREFKRKMSIRQQKEPEATLPRSSTAYFPGGKPVTPSPRPF